MLPDRGPKRPPPPPTTNYVPVVAPAAPPKPAGAAVSSKNWPPSLRDFVARVFKEAASKEARAQAQALLKEVIAEANAAGELWTRDWNSYSLATLRQPPPPQAAPPWRFAPEAPAPAPGGGGATVQPRGWKPTGSNTLELGPMRTFGADPSPAEPSPKVSAQTRKPRRLHTGPSRPSPGC